MTIPSNIQHQNEEQRRLSRTKDAKNTKNYKKENHTPLEQLERNEQVARYAFSLALLQNTQQLVADPNTNFLQKQIKMYKTEQSSFFNELNKVLDEKWLIIALMTYWSTFPQYIQNPPQRFLQAAPPIKETRCLIC